MRRSLCLALAGAVVGLAILTPGIASAAAPSCATAPPAYTGTDATVAAITQLNIDADENCSAVVARLDTLDGDVTSGTSTSDTDLKAINGTLSGWTASNPLQVTLPGGGSGSAVQVTNWPADQTVGLDSASSSQSDGQAHALHIDLWMLIGAVVACMLFDVFLRKVWP